MQYSVIDLPSIAKAIRSRREHLGLSQDRLAALVGLSRATVNELENGQGADLGFNKVIRLLRTIGLSIVMHDASTAVKRSRRGGLIAASQTASTSYRTALPPQALAQAMRTGQIPSEFRAHIATLLDEAPIPIIVSAVEESFRTPVPKSTWRHLASWASEFKCTRQVWA